MRTNGTNGHNGTPRARRCLSSNRRRSTRSAAEAASNNWDAVGFVNAQSLNGGYRSSHTNGNQTSYVEWRLPLEAGRGHRYATSNLTTRQYYDLLA